VKLRPRSLFTKHTWSPYDLFDLIPLKAHRKQTLEKSRERCSPHVISPFHEPSLFQVLSKIHTSVRGVWLELFVRNWVNFFTGYVPLIWCHWRITCFLFQFVIFAEDVDQVTKDFCDNFESWADGPVRRSEAEHWHTWNWHLHWLVCILFLAAICTSNSESSNWAVYHLICTWRCVRVLSSVFYLLLLEAYWLPRCVYLYISCNSPG
jgi:hypothetical protein